MPKHIEYRWAILVKWQGEASLAGRGCWTGSILSRSDAPLIPTFTTRDDARLYVRDMTSFRKCAKPIRVAVTTATIEAKDDAK